LSEKQVVLAAIAGAHGIGGEVRLKLFSENLEGLKRHKRLFAGQRPLSLVSLRGGKDGAIARFGGIDDRNAAEAFRGQLLSVPRSELPPLAEGEYYHVDLIGLPCVDQAGNSIGRVVAVENFGAGDLLEIETEAGKRSLVPLRPEIAELGGERIVVDPVFLA
jgi:16S rRNA processing protein RimM